MEEFKIIKRGKIQSISHNGLENVTASNVVFRYNYALLLEGLIIKMKEIMPELEWQLLDFKTQEAIIAIINKKGE